MASKTTLLSMLETGSMAIISKLGLDFQSSGSARAKKFQARRPGPNFFQTVYNLRARKSPGLNLKSLAELFSGLASLKSAFLT